METRRLKHSLYLCDYIHHLINLREIIYLVCFKATMPLIYSSFMMVTRPLWSGYIGIYSYKAQEQSSESSSSFFLHASYIKTLLLSFLKIDHPEKMVHMLTISQLETLSRLLRKVLLEVLLDVLLSWVVSEILRGLDRLVGMLAVTTLRTFFSLKTCGINRVFVS